MMSRVLVFRCCKKRNSAAESGNSAENPRQAIRNSAENLWPGVKLRVNVISWHCSSLSDQCQRRKEC